MHCQSFLNECPTYKDWYLYGDVIQSTIEVQEVSFHPGRGVTSTYSIGMNHPLYGTVTKIWISDYKETVVDDYQTYEQENIVCFVQTTKGGVKSVRPLVNTHLNVHYKKSLTDKEYSRYKIS